VNAVLEGGNSNEVERIGDTVHRMAGAWTPAVHRLLQLLRESGIHEVPEPLGFDERGREILSFLDGETGNYPLPEWLWAPTIVDDAGALLRRIHDASVPLVNEDLEWAHEPRQPAEVICHNDVAPYNMAFRNGRLVGLFDFDTAAPGPRIWDLAYLAYRLAPLAEDVEPDAPAGAARLDRIDRLIAAYGHPYRRAELLSTAVDRLVELADDTERRGAEPGREALLDHAAMYRRDAAAIATLQREA
jgi:Ser/Thr protein kinase RdoA (MazF antagonist)